MNTNTTEPDGVVSGEQLGGEPRWYCLSADGMATLCVDEEDAKEVAAESWVLYPKNAPYRATQMVEASVVAAAVAAERERWATVDSALRTAIHTLERDGDEWGVCEHLRAALKPNTELKGRHEEN